MTITCPKKYVYTVCTINANYSSNECFVVYNTFFILFILQIGSHHYCLWPIRSERICHTSIETQIIGKIIKAIGPNEYEGLFQNGMTHVSSSNKLKIVAPEDVPPSMRNTTETNMDETSRFRTIACPVPDSDKTLLMLQIQMELKYMIIMMPTVIEKLLPMMQKQREKNIVIRKLKLLLRLRL